MKVGHYPIPYRRIELVYRTGAGLKLASCFGRFRKNHVMMKSFYREEKGGLEVKDDKAWENGCIWEYTGEPVTPNKAETAPKVKTLPLYHYLTPIWTKEMGARLITARMKMDLDQTQLGKKLGVSQTVVSKIETGRIGVVRAGITLAKLIEVFDADVDYILLGTNEDATPTAYIHRVYAWKKKHPGQEVPHKLRKS